MRVTSQYLDSHALQIIQSIDQPSEIPAMAHLVGVEVMFEERPVNIIICRIPIHESVKKEGIDWEAPIFRRWEVCMIGPFAPILGWVCRSLVFVEIVVNEAFIIWPA